MYYEAHIMQHFCLFVCVTSWHILQFKVNIKRWASTPG